MRFRRTSRGLERTQRCGGGPNRSARQERQRHRLDSAFAGRQRPRETSQLAEANGGVVKRRAPRTFAARRDKGSGTPDTRVLVVNVLGSRRRSDASRARLAGSRKASRELGAQPKGNRHAAGAGDGGSMVKRCAEVALVKLDLRDGTPHGRWEGESLRTAPRVQDTTEGTLVDWCPRKGEPFSGRRQAISG